MIEIREETRDILRKGVPLFIGAAAGSVVSTVVKTNFVPEKDRVFAQIIWRIGIFGISTVVSGAVCSHFESEINAFLRAWDDVVGDINEAKKPTTLSSEDIAEIKAEVYNEQQTGPIQPQGDEADTE